MSYEIPQKLQYEEKVLFGLTFKQMIYCLIFIFPALIIFIKTSLPLMIKLTISTVLIALGVLFMFFNFMSYLKNIIYWLRFRNVLMSDRKMKDFLGIKKIEGGIIYEARK